MYRLQSSLLFLALATAIPAPGLAAEDAAGAGHAIANIRNARYCEIFVVTRKAIRLNAAVYNTLGLNDCPEAAWKAIDQEALKKEFDAVAIVMNGPRYFIMDSMDSMNISSRVTDFQGIGMREAAAIEIPMFQGTADRKPYQARTIDRTTDWYFNKGSPAFELIDEKGTVYVMQSYSQIVDPSLGYDQLAALGSRLKLPPGWKYLPVTLDADLKMHAAGKAYIVQDDLENTYQRVTE